MAEGDRFVVSVSELNQYVRQSLSADPILRDLRLRGEVSGIKYYPNAWYFQLKDESARISCVLFRMAVQRASFRPKDGDAVILHGSASIYAERGEYQFVADSIRPEGVGLLWQQYERLKAKLAGEGLFDASRKRPLPVRPRRIAVLTSASGAVWHDIHKICRERDPGVALVLVPVPVQGEGAAAEIVEGLHKAVTLPQIDLVIVGRGGGSMEELWCFNDEALVRAIAACPIPVISAVGHETDFTLCDFAADRRASTPSNAAEMAVPDCADAVEGLRMVRARLDRAALHAVQSKTVTLLALRDRLEAASPQVKLNEMITRRAALASRLSALTESLLHEKLLRLERLRLRADQAADSSLAERERMLLRQRTRAEALNPMRVLERGYALVLADGKPVCAAKDAPSRMTLRFADGSVRVRREETENGGT